MTAQPRAPARANLESALSIETSQSSGLPGVEVNTGRGRLSGSLDRLLGVLDLVVGLVQELLALVLSISSEVLALGNGLVDLVSDRGEEEGGGGGEEGVGSVRRHFDFGCSVTSMSDSDKEFSARAVVQ